MPASSQVVSISAAASARAALPSSEVVELDRDSVPMDSVPMLGKLRNTLRSLHCESRVDRLDGVAASRRLAPDGLVLLGVPAGLLLLAPERTNFGAWPDPCAGPCELLRRGNMLHLLNAYRTSQRRSGGQDYGTEREIGRPPRQGGLKPFLAPLSLSQSVSR